MRTFTCITPVLAGAALAACGTPEQPAVSTSFELTAELSILRRGSLWHRVPGFRELALATGLRWGEIHGLAWADVDLDAQPCTITIRRSWQGDPKTDHSAATMPISDDAASILRQWKAEQGDAVYVFPDAKGEIRRYSDVKNTRAIAEAAQAAGIVARITPHVFRHTFATWAYERAQDPRKLQKLMRHASFQTSMGYVHDRSGAC